MTLPAHIRARVRRTVGVVCLLVVASVLALPMVLGPAIAPVLRGLGAEMTHRCACGMKVGTCGCPECARLEHQRQDDAEPRAHAVLKSDCDEDSVAPSGALPLATLPSSAWLLKAPLAGDRGAIRSERPLPREPRSPPTPPPRTVRA